MPKIEVSGIWFRTIGSTKELLIEVNDEWKVVPIYSGSINSWPMSEILEMRPETWPNDWLAKKE